MARFPEVDTPLTAPRLHVRVKVIRRECRSHLPATGVFCGAELISPWEALALEAQACPGAAPRCAGTPKLSLSEPTQTAFSWGIHLFQVPFHLCELSAVRRVEAQRLLS